MRAFTFGFVTVGVVSAASSGPAALLGARSMVSVVPVDKLCPSDEFEYDGERDVCKAKIQKPFVYSCSSGSKLVDDVCLFEELFPPEKRCPADAIFNGQECEISKIAAVTLKCDPGDVLMNGECWSVDPQQPRASCPKGYELQPQNRCVFTTRTRPEYVCPRAFAPVSDKPKVCQRSLAAKPKINCPPGAVLSGTQCLNPKVEVTPRKECLSGGDLDVNGRCVAVASVSADLVCAPGFAISNGRCEKPVSRQPAMRCPREFELNDDGMCVKMVAPELVCASETETLTANGVCVSLMSEEPRRECPERSVPDAEGKCSVQVVYDKDVRLSCDDRFGLVEGKCLQRLRINGDAIECPAHHTLNKANTECVATEEVGAEAMCAGRADFDASSETCLASTSIDAMLSCGKGAELSAHHGVCISRRLYQPQANCENGYTLKKKASHSECVHREVLAAEKSCTDLGKLDEKGRCVKQTIVRALRKCPSGFEIMTTGDISACVKIDEVPTLKICPDDFQLVGNACIGKVVTQDSTLSSEDRKLLHEVLEGNGVKKSASLRRAITNEKAADSQLLGMIAKLPTKKKEK